MTDKEIKQKIRELKKLKLSCRAGSKERIDLHRQIKELKSKMESLSVIDTDKQILIDKILEQDKSFTDLGINLQKFTIEQLKFHLKKIFQK